MQINKMAALPTPKKNSYIVKKDGAEKIFDRKLGKSTENTIMENAAIFARNNIVKKVIWLAIYLYKSVFYFFR